MKYLDMTVPHDQFTIDGVPSKVKHRVFCGEEKTPKAQRDDGVILDEIVFQDPNTGAETYESSHSIELFAFNGTTILTPSAVNVASSLGVHDIDEEQLEGKLLVIDCLPLFAMGPEEIARALYDAGVVDEKGTKTDHEKYIVLFNTGRMRKVLKYVDERGIPKEGFGETQKRRPGISPEGAVYLTRLDIAKAYAIDNISFEHFNARPGFAATQLLMNADEEARTFVPLVYHVAKTETPEFESLRNKKPYARIELGNIPYNGRMLTGHPVAFKVRMQETRR